MERVDLRIIGGRNNDKIITIPKKKFIIGREEDCHLRPTSQAISRHHCVISQDDYGVHLRDLGSTSGTFLNGNRIQGTVGLNSGDLLSIGKLKFEVLIFKTAAVTQQDQSSNGSSTGINSSDSVLPQGDVSEHKETVELSSHETRNNIEPVDPETPQGPNADV